MIIGNRDYGRQICMCFKCKNANRDSTTRQLKNK